MQSSASHLTQPPSKAPPKETLDPPKLDLVEDEQEEEYEREPGGYDLQEDEPIDYEAELRLYNNVPWFEHPDRNLP